MSQLTTKQETDIYVAKMKIENRGVNAYATKLAETDLQIIEKVKKILLIKFKSKEIKITPEYAKQVINIDNLINLKNFFDSKKDGFIRDVGKEEFDLMHRNLYYALNIYSLKLDEKFLDANIDKLIKICENRVTAKRDYYGNVYTLNPLFEQEKKFLKVLLRYNTQKIANYQSQHLSTAQMERDSEEKDK